MLIVCVERGSQIHGISWQLAVWCSSDVVWTKANFSLLYVRRIATETRQHCFLCLHFTANIEVRTLSNYKPYLCFNLYRLSHVAHAKIYALFRKLKLTTDGKIFALLTYFENLSRRLTVICPKKFLQESVDHPSAIQSSEAQSIWRFRTWWKLIIFVKYFNVNEIHVFEI